MILEARYVEYLDTVYCFKVFYEYLDRPALISSLHRKP